jgi:hypothetical protein
MFCFTFNRCGLLAQLVEHWIPNPKAIGSTPVGVSVFYILTALQPPPHLLVQPKHVEETIDFGVARVPRGSIQSDWNAHARRLLFASGVHGSCNRRR